ncbi:MAG: FG-GAP and VCBS repeat-containing protein [Proteobacteria bacterium]|nr:FG-GAP and VCBS repeat-containing protein [Pseudomonadota bacterium]
MERISDEGDTHMVIGQVPGVDRRAAAVKQLDRPAAREAGVIWTLASVLFCGCSVSDDGAGMLTIVSPAPNQMFTPADDISPDQPGFQTLVAVTSTNLTRQARIVLHVDAGDPVLARLLEGVGAPDDAGNAMIMVTLPAGTHELSAETFLGSVRSAGVVYTAPDLGGGPPIGPGGCPTALFVTPLPPAMGATQRTLGPGSDTVGEGCGMTFATTVALATNALDGVEGQLFVNGTPGPVVAAAGGALVFDDVELGNRGTFPNLLEVRFNLAGVVCDALRYPGDLLVDCEGASCELTAPRTDTGFLNLEDDVSSMPGFQTDFQVTTDSSAANQPVRLIVDGNFNTPPMMNPVVNGPQAIATFGGVSLEDGGHTVFAECRDDAGNLTRSAAGRWVVDTVPCTLGIDSPAAGTSFIETDDVNSMQAGLQVELEGTLMGDGCTGVRAAECTGIEGVPFQTHDGSRSVSANVTLSSNRMQSLCLEVRDVARNVAQERVAVERQSDAPKLAFAVPDPQNPDALRFNSAGNTYEGQSYVADLDPTTPACDVRFEVLCDEVGRPVTLHVEATGVQLSGGSADCVAAPAMPMGFRGRATFASVAVAAGTSPTVNIVARQQGGRLEGQSSPLTLNHDCQPPDVLFYEQDPVDGALCQAFTPSTSGGEITKNVRVFSPVAALELKIFRTDGMTPAVPVFTSTTPVPSGASQFLFPNVSFQNGGTYSVVVEATDGAGNLGITPPCQVQVVDIPTLAITAPMNGAALDASGGCAGTGMFNVQVEATTDAAAGSLVEIQIADLPVETTSVGVSGDISECVAAKQGEVDIRVRVSDTARGGAFAEQVLTVTIDSLPPPNPITDLTLLDPTTTPATEDDNPRAGTVRFRWTAVDDAAMGQPLAGYELRCVVAPGQIADEASWSAARSYTLGVNPAAGGNVQEANVSGFRMGEPVRCILRGVDGGGQLTPLPAASDPGYNVPVALSFRDHQVQLAGSARLGMRMVALGDVNGDGRPDLMLGGDGEAYLYFGARAGDRLPDAPSVTFTGLPDSMTVQHGAFGEQIAGLGDFNGDGCADFAIGEGAGLGSTQGGDMGRVYVFFGRDADPGKACPDEWPTAIDVPAGCGVAGRVDVCLVSSESLAVLGGRVDAVGDFDGDGLSDLATSARFASGFEGRVYVVLGRKAYASGTRIVVPGTPGMAGNDPDGFVFAVSGRYQFGWGVTGVGDLQGDNRSDLVITTLGRGRTGTPWSVYRVFGQTYSAGGGLVAVDQSELLEIASGPPTGSPVRVAALGDVVGGSGPDLGLWFLAGGLGQVQVWPGDGLGSFDPSQAVVLDNAGGANTDSLGVAMASVRGPFSSNADIDGDGKGELFIGSAGLGGHPGAGLLFYADNVASGAQSGAIGTDVASVRLRHDMAGEPLIVAGNSSDNQNVWGFVQYVGDINGDGFPDLAFGDPKSNSGRGRVQILY